MSFELSEIKKIRKHLGITQSDLAKKAGVSQSLIAKIEADRIDPTFTKAKQIFDTLQLLEKKQEVKAVEVMNEKIITVSPQETIKDAVLKMKKYEISQMPVMDHHSVIGLLSESTLLNALIEQKGKTAQDIMEEAPPAVSKNASIEVVSGLLRHYPVVLVTQEGKVKGLITKADLISKLYKR